MNNNFTPELARQLAILNDREAARKKERHARDQRCNIGRQYTSPFREISLYGNENLGIAEEILNQQR